MESSRYSTDDNSKSSGKLSATTLKFANFQEFVSNVLQKPHVFVHRFSLVHYSFPAFFRNFPFSYVNLSRPFDTFLSIHVSVYDAYLSHPLASLTVHHAFVSF